MSFSTGEVGVGSADARPMATFALVYWASAHARPCSSLSDAIASTLAQSMSGSDSESLSRMGLRDGTDSAAAPNKAGLTEETGETGGGAASSTSSTSSTSSPGADVVAFSTTAGASAKITGSASDASCSWVSVSPGSALFVAELKGLSALAADGSTTAASFSAAPQTAEVP